MRELISNARCVLFDFDGPVCSLFAARSAESIARRLRDLAMDLDASALLTPALRVSPDPHEVLRGVARQHPDPVIVHRLERALTHEEISAAATAQPTPYASALIAALSTRGRLMAVVTNNSPLAVELYLDKHGLAGYIGGRIHGRTKDVSLLKPHPDPLFRALRSTGARACQSLMIGDAPADLSAARSAGVPFLGYAQDDTRERTLREEGACFVTRSLQRVLTLVVAPTFG